VIISNTLGQTIYTNSIKNQIENISLNSKIENGIYYIQLIDNKNNVIDISKIFIQK